MFAKKAIQNLVYFLSKAHEFFNSIFICKRLKRGPFEFQGRLFEVCKRAVFIQQNHGLSQARNCPQSVLRMEKISAFALDRVER